MVVMAGCGAAGPAPADEVTQQPAQPAPPQRPDPTPPGWPLIPAPRPNPIAPPAAPIVAATWDHGAWHVRLGRRGDDLGKEPSRVLAVDDLAAFGVGALEPTLTLFRVGAEPCTVTVLGYELTRPNPDFQPARDGYYDETAVRATASGCEPQGVTTAWLVAPSFLAAQSDATAWRLVAVDVTGARIRDQPLPRRYRGMQHSDDEPCTTHCYIAWELRRLPVEPRIEHIAITISTWTDDIIDTNVLDEGAFSLADKTKPTPLTFPTRTMVGAFVVDDRPVAVLFDDDYAYATAMMDADTLAPETVSFVHDEVGY
jgi:hypothetical protein